MTVPKCATAAMLNQRFERKQDGVGIGRYNSLKEMALVAYDSSDTDESGKEEDSVHLKNKLSILSTPKNMRRVGPVKIGLPALDKNTEVDSDDDDQSSPAASRKEGGAGLTSILPPPRMTASKLVSKTTPTSQTMVPYTVSRHGRGAAASRGMKKVLKHGGSKERRRGDNSDSDDDEPVSFFSHLDTPSRDDEEQYKEGVASEDGSGLVQAAPSAPRPFSVERLGDDTNTLEPSLVKRLWEESVEGVSQEEEQPHPLVQPPMHLPGAGPGLSMDDQTYRRLTGACRKRARDSALNNLIEINEDDVKVGMETYRKNLSEESVEKMYKPPDGSKPTSQQKRKHQLSFLAHHAKENELKLLKQWAQSAATRRDTQMKYGF